MHFDPAVLAVRSWAVPALGALLDLHQDFDPPRHVSLEKVAWTKRSCCIDLEYGTQNFSGDVKHASRFSVAIHMNGIVSIRPKDPASKEAAALGQFIAGEINRQARLWQEHFQAWCEGMPEPGTAVVCSMAHGIAGFPAHGIHAVVHRTHVQPRSVHKIVLTTKNAEIELTPNGDHGLCWFVRDPARPRESARLVQLMDLRPATSSPTMSNWWTRSLGGAQALLWFGLLPLDIGSRFLEHLERKAKDESKFSDIS
ncbi:hypothetical protein [Noviherbaspirillum galbum]|uniref:Uncharacterized protein n=1 Tax=Noviherbaspirillum galbum TaxID=2709383 RepID=A0A6B3SQU0_9BURK|nr:hypothetical protein [Noviherbaspirillum galbum]NEX63011.1 hypothetical protein [Noviherbaspirillum galbum]